MADTTKTVDETLAAEASLLTVEVWDDWFSPGRHAEDGEPVIASAFSLRVTLPDGRRFVHKHSFRRTHFCEVQGCFWDEEPCEASAKDKYRYDATAKADAEKLLARIQAAQKAQTWKGPFNDNWVETRPAYGSDAYVRSGQEAEDAAWEREQDKRRF